MTATTVPSGSLPLREPGNRLRLLAGVRVLDLTSSLAGPYATLLLADLGAEVLKIERPGVGDDSRHWLPPELAGMSLWFASVNRNKSSMTLDYSRPEGYEVLLDLVRKCDVVITNQLPRVQEKLKVSYRHLSAEKPDIVMVSLTGFGVEGERADMPCYDLIAEGYSGVMDLTGETDGPPQKVGTPAADLLSGMDAALGCLAALFDRAATGSGHFVDVALVDSMTRFMSPRLVSYLGSGQLARRSGGTDSVIAIYQVFPTADEPITLALANDNVWKRFCTAVDRRDLLEDSRLRSNAERVLQRSRLVNEIADILVQKDRAYWLDLFSREAVPAGPINRLDQISADPHLLNRGLFYAINRAGARLPQVNLGIRFDGRAAGFDLPPPELGAQTGEVLEGLLGYSRERLTQLKERQLI